MDMRQLIEMTSMDADSSSFLFSILITILFYFKYKELEQEATEEDLMDNFLNES